jgi:S-methyl-5-thioribose-1-phosphate isomerase
MLVNGRHYLTVWREGSTVRMIDQNLLPFRFQVFDAADHRATAAAIRDMTTRGAGAIGTAAGFAVAQAAGEAPADAAGFEAYVQAAAALVRATRPTARNLFYAVDRVLAAALAALPDIAGARSAACAAADAMAREDAETGRLIGEAGSPLIQDGARVLTHCNAGWLAFTDWGTALSPIYTAARAGRRAFVWVDETRPRLQGARLTAWELSGEGIDFRVIPDNAAGYFMRRKEVDLVIVGADRIAANGDVANKIGTYEKAVLARENGIPFYVAAPFSTVDVDCPNGDAIPIEERGEEEVLNATGPDAEGTLRTLRVVSPGARARNPAFDVTPAALVKGIITERGVVSAGEIAARARDAARAS